MGKEHRAWAALTRRAFVGTGMGCAAMLLGGCAAMLGQEDEVAEEPPEVTGGRAFEPGDPFYVSPEQAEQLQREKQEGIALAVAGAVPLGEWRVLTNGTREERIVTGARNHGDWVGSMGIRVDWAWLFPSIGDAQVEVDLGTVTSIGEYYGERDDDIQFLVVGVTVSNVDAVGPFVGNDGAFYQYTIGLDNPPAPDYLFNAMAFKPLFSANLTNELSSYNGCLTVAGANPNLMLSQYYQAEPGQEHELALGWWVPADHALSDLYVHVDYLGDKPYPEVVFSLVPTEETS